MMLNGATVYGNIKLWALDPGTQSDSTPPYMTFIVGITEVPDFRR